MNTLSGTLFGMRHAPARARCRLLPLLALGALLLGAAPASAGRGRANQTKQTTMVAMRDGVKLATDVYLPWGQGPFPAVLARTPYNKDGLSGFVRDGLRWGYAVVVQDVRGRFASEGKNLPFEFDGWVGSWDGCDTVAWVAGQPWCNGKIGTWGLSALGIAQLAMAGAGARQVVCQHIAVAAPRLYHDEAYPGGIFRKSLVEDWLRTSGYSPESLKLWTSHPTYDGYWRARDVSLRYSMVDVPAVHVGGWYDIFAQGTIDSFLGYQTQGGPRARGQQKLVMGPWTHSLYQESAGDLTYRGGAWPPNTACDPWRWFGHHLYGAATGIMADAVVTYYVMGDATDPRAPGNVWRTADAWPPVPVTETSFFLRADRAVSLGKPPEKARPLKYAYNPRDPVPTIGGYELSIPSGPRDQRPIEGRPDVLVFSTEPLEEPLEITGRPRALLWISSDAPDTDFIVRVCDVYPDGRSMNVCQGGLRARFRESFAAGKLMAPGQLYRLSIDLWSTSIIFNRGHRIRVHVTSSSSPGLDPNPNTGEPFRASSRTRVAHNTLYTDFGRPSHIVLPVAKPQ